MKKKTVNALKWIGIAIILLAVLYTISSFRANNALSKAYAALEADGRPMKAEDIIPPQIPDEDNAALVYDSVILRLKAEDVGGQNALEKLEELKDVITADPAARDAESKAKYAAAKKEFQEIISRPAVADALASLEAGTRKSGCRYDIKYDDGAGALLPHVSPLRSLSRILGVMAIIQAEDGDSAAAWDTILTSLRLANALDQEPLLISKLVRIAQARIAMDSVKAVAQICAPSDAQYETLQALLSSFEVGDGFATAMDGERLLLGEWAFNLSSDELAESVGGSSSGLQRAGAAILVRSPLIKYDHATYLRVLHTYSQMYAQPYSPDTVDIADKIIEDTPRYKCIISSLLVPALGKAHITFLSSVARARVARAGLAVLKHKRVGGSYPKSLEALNINGLTDPFTGKPLTYRATESGFVVYSFGENAEDDGGTHSKLREKGDIVWRCAESGKTE